MGRKLILASAVSLAILPGAAWCAGLGGIRTESVLDQPFVGEIELNDVDPDELDTIKVGIASPAEFAEAGAPRPEHLNQLRFVPQVTTSGRTVVRVESGEPIREPYLDFLVELISPQGRIVKGYTVLLDPPVTIDRSAPSLEPVRQGPPAPAGDAGGRPLRWGPVPAGKGLWRLASEDPPEGATVAQTAMALYRNNPQAFIKGDINRLRVGAELRIPTAAALFALDVEEAERQYLAALHGGQFSATPLTEVTAAPRAADRLEIAAAPAVQGPEPQPPKEAAAGGESGLASFERSLLLVQESAESTRQETEELRTRVRELESQLADIKRLLELRDEQLAQLQLAAAAVGDGGPGTAAISGVDEGGASARGVPQRGSSGTDEAEMDPPAAGAPVAAGGAGGDDWRDIPLAVPALAVAVPALLLLLALSALVRRKRTQRAAQREGAETAQDRASGEPQELVPDAVAGASQAVGATTDAESAASYDGTDDADILSEADVYIAYGRYREAEGLLIEELKRSPERLELRLKLGEAYFGAKNAAALDGQIAELREAGADTLYPEQWQRLILMSRELAGLGSSLFEPADLALRPGLRHRADNRTDPGGAGRNLAEKAPPAGEEARPPGRLGQAAVAGRTQASPAASSTGSSVEASGRAPGQDQPAAFSGGRGPKAGERDSAAAPGHSPSSWQVDPVLWDEVVIKLDLARAYLGMAEKEAARDLLGEIAVEGDDGQRSEALEMLSRLD
jgi:pilus assembly protein FimV